MEIFYREPILQVTTRLQAAIQRQTAVQIGERRVQNELKRFEPKLGKLLEASFGRPSESSF